MRFIYTRAFAFFSAFLVFVVIITFLQVMGFAAPIRAVFINAPRPVAYVFGGVSKPFKSFFSTIYGLKKIAQDNVALSSQVYSLQQQLASYNQAMRENQALKKELGFVQTSKSKNTPCTVLAENPLELTNTLVINCGKDEGVTEGQGVVSQGYLVGKVIYAGKDSSTVLLITSSQFSSDARLSRGGSTGVVAGSFGSGIVLDQISQNDTLTKGDLVVTAGINNQIPKDFLIGQVGDQLSSQNDLFKKATILSPIDFANLQFVFVVQ